MGKGLVKDKDDPCSEIELSLWEKFVGVKKGSLLGEEECPKEGDVSINNQGRNSVVKEIDEDGESSDTETGVLQ